MHHLGVGWSANKHQEPYPPPPPVKGMCYYALLFKMWLLGYDFEPMHREQYFIGWHFCADSSALKASVMMVEGKWLPSPQNP